MPARSCRRAVESRRAHASARSAVRGPRRGHPRGHPRRAGLAGRRGRPAVSRLLLLRRPIACSPWSGRAGRRSPVGDRIVSVDGGSPLPAGRVRATAAARALRARPGRPAPRRELAPAPFTWACWSIGSPRTSWSPRSCWRRVVACSRRTRPRGPTVTSCSTCACGPCPTWSCPRRSSAPQVRSAAIMAASCPPLLSVHGWVFFLTYPVNPPAPGVARPPPRRSAPLPRGDRARRRAAAVFGAGLRGRARPVRGRRLALPAARQLPFAPGRSSRSRSRSWRSSTPAAAPPRRWSTSRPRVLLLGIGLGLGCWLALMLLPLTYFYARPSIPRWARPSCSCTRRPSPTRPCATGSSTPRVVIRRSLVYTVLAGLITGAYALLIALANAVLAQADLHALAVVLRRVHVRGRRSPSTRCASACAGPSTGCSSASARRARGRCRRWPAGCRACSTWTRSPAASPRRSSRRCTCALRACCSARRRPPWSAVLDAAPGALSRYQVAADPRFAALRRRGASPPGTTSGARWWCRCGSRTQARGLLVLGPQALGRRLHRRGPRAAGGAWPTRPRSPSPTRSRTGRCSTTRGSSSAACSSARTWRSSSPSACAS